MYLTRKLTSPWRHPSDVSLPPPITYDSSVLPSRLASRCAFVTPVAPSDKCILTEEDCGTNLPISMADGISETSALISSNGGIPNDFACRYSAVATKHDDTEDDHTTWQSEARICAGYSQSLVLTLLLQYSLNLTSVITVGRLGTAELGAVSLASVTANITGYAVYQGLG